MDPTDALVLRWRSRVATASGLSLLGLALVPAVRGHDGSVHAGTPHWILLAVFVSGLGVVGGSWYLGRTARATRSRSISGAIFAGMGLVVLGAIGLTELQLEPLATNATPIPRAWYPIVAFVTGTGLVVGTLLLGRVRWPHRPGYTALGCLLGIWVAYPVLIPGTDYWHPVGYLLVLGVPLLVGHLLWRDVRPALTGIDRVSRRAGATVAALFTAFLLVSTGQFTFNPETGANVPHEAFVVTTRFVNPLVMWPAVEFYLPSIPLFGALSIGTVVVLGLLAGLAGVNAALVAAIWRLDLPIDYSMGAMGGVAATGATACGCCAPAAYGIASAILGLSVSPLYWAFLDPASPAGALFFVGATGLMTASTIRSATVLAEAGVCERP